MYHLAFNLNRSYEVVSCEGNTALLPSVIFRDVPGGEKRWLR